MGVNHGNQKTHQEKNHQQETRAQQAYWPVPSKMMRPMEAKKTASKKTEHGKRSAPVKK